MQYTFSVWDIFHIQIHSYQKPQHESLKAQELVCSVIIGFNIYP